MSGGVATVFFFTTGGGGPFRTVPGDAFTPLDDDAPPPSPPSVLELSDA